MARSEEEILADIEKLGVPRGIINAELKKRGVLNPTEQNVIGRLKERGVDTSSFGNQPDSGPATAMQGMASEVLEYPRKLSRDVLSSMANKIPEFIGGESKNTSLNIAKGTPRVLADIAAEVLPEQVSPAALMMTAATAGAGALAKAPLVKKAGNLALKTGAGAIEKTLGIEAEKVANLFKKPLSLFTAPTKSKVAKAYAGSELREAEKTLESIVDQGTTAYGGTVKRAGKALLKQEKNADVYLRGRKALDKQIASIESQMATAKSGKSALKDALDSKFALREEFNKALDILAPKHRSADRMAAEQFSVEPFRRMTLPGRINFMSPEGIARAIPGLPFALGGGVSGAGALAQGASPAAAASMVAALESLSKRRKK